PRRTAMSDARRKPRIVYSTGLGRVCPECGRAIESCVCTGKKGASPFEALGASRTGPASHADRDRAGGGAAGGHGGTSVSGGSGPRTAGAPVAKLRLETKGRGGKSVTVIYEVSGGSIPLEDLARELKRACGTGGSV